MVEGKEKLMEESKMGTERGWGMEKMSRGRGEYRKERVEIERRK